LAAVNIVHRTTREDIYISTRRLFIPARTERTGIYAPLTPHQVKTFYLGLHFEHEFSKMIKRAVITAAGEGSRMLPLTRGMRKEMLPLCARSAENGLTLKPVVHMILEDLYDLGIREFCFVVRSGEHLVQDYFTIKPSYLEYLEKSGKLSGDLNRLRHILSDSTVHYVRQTVPRGFGDAVLKAKEFVGDESFVLHAGDGYLLHGKEFLQRMFSLHISKKSFATLAVRRVENPSRYGVISGKFVSDGRTGAIKVDTLVEKPSEPKSNLAIVAVYLLTHEIMKMLENTQTSHTGEKELTDGIMTLVRSHKKVYALELDSKTKWLSVGDPRGYLRALEETKISVEDSLAYASRFSGR